MILLIMNDILFMAILDIITKNVLNYQLGDNCSRFRRTFLEKGTTIAIQATRLKKFMLYSYIVRV